MDKMKKLRSRAFTLAEVLITLGVIGVVAALTLPQVIQQYKRVEVETKLKRVYSIMNQAILESENVNGPQEYWECPTSASGFTSKYITPYLNDYMTKTITAYGVHNQLIYLNDGSLLIAKYGGDCEYDFFFYPNSYNFDTNTLNTQDENGVFTSQRPDCGITFFAFKYAYKSASARKIFHKQRGFEPYKMDLTSIDKQSLTSGTFLGCNKNATNKAYCTALIQLNGWKIPKDYPFNVR